MIKKVSLILIFFMLAAEQFKAQQVNTNHFASIAFLDEYVYVIPNKYTFQIGQEGVKNPPVISTQERNHFQRMHRNLRLDFSVAPLLRNDNFGFLHSIDPIDEFLYKLKPLNEYSGSSVIINKFNPAIGSSIESTGIRSIFSIKNLNEEADKNTPQVEEKTFSITPAIYYFLGGAAAAVIIYFLLPDRGSEASKTGLTFGIPISPK